MADGNRGGEGGPLLLYGERLRREVPRPGMAPSEKFHPLEPAEARELLRPFAESLVRDVAALPESLRGPRIIFQATLYPNYLAASYFPSRLLEEIDAVPIGSRSSVAPYQTAARFEEEAETKSLLLAGTERSLQRLTELLESGGHGKTERDAAEQFRELSDIRLSSVTEVLGARHADADAHVDDRPLWEAVLHPGAASRGPDLLPVDDETFAKWIRYIRSLEGEVLTAYRREVGGLTFVPVRLDQAVTADAARFNPLRSLRPMPAMRPIQPGLLRATRRKVAPPGLLTPESDLRVAVFDGGIDASGGMYPTCTAHTLAVEPEELDEVAHGSAVAGAVLYGNVVDTGPLRQPVANVDLYRVLPSTDPADPEAYWILDRIVETLDKTDHRIVNLSLGPNVCVEDASEPNRWTSTLDEYAYEHDVLFVSAAGNNGEEDAATGLNRVQVPADMANGLSVGACDRHAPEAEWERAAYSAVGPGRSGSRIQPTGVQFGGADHNPFMAVLGDGTLAETAGTSFAAPLVVHSLCRLSTVIGLERMTLNNTRALAVHLAEREEDSDSLVDEMGHGRFLPDFDSALQCEPHEVLVIYEDQIERGDVISLAIPFPNQISSGNFEVAWTLALTAPTEPTQATEYTQATLEPVFRPHDQKYRLTNEAGRSRIVNVASEADRVAALYREGYVASATPTSVAVPGTRGSEDTRREGGKWETVRHFRKTFRASSLRNPRLDLSYVAREGGLLTQVCTPLEYTLVVSITGRRGGVSLYESVRAEFPVLSPVDVAIQAEARARARAN